MADGQAACDSICWKTKVKGKEIKKSKKFKNQKAGGRSPSLEGLSREHDGKISFHLGSCLDSPPSSITIIRCFFFFMFPRQQSSLKGWEVVVMVTDLMAADTDDAIGGGKGAWPAGRCSVIGCFEGCRSSPNCH